MTFFKRKSHVSERLEEPSLSDGFRPRGRCGCPPDEVLRPSARLGDQIPVGDFRSVENRKIMSDFVTKLLRRPQLCRAGSSTKIENTEMVNKYWRKLKCLYLLMHCMGAAAKVGEHTDLRMQSGEKRVPRFSGGFRRS